MSEPVQASRRTAILVAATAAAAGLAGCKGHGEAGGDISASEDLMREHGVLRRILVLYREAAARLRTDAGALDAGALSGAANLFRQFGEDYHERKLEEERVFPQVRRAGGPAARLVDTLAAQHNRGREINLFVIDRARGGRIGGGDVEAVAKALDSFSRMYEAHAAIEDTVVFQAWRKSLSGHQLSEASEEFEKIERAQFKGDGFDQGVDAISDLERRLGIAELAGFTAPSPGPLMA